LEFFIFGCQKYDEKPKISKEKMKSTNGNISGIKHETMKEEPTQKNWKFSFLGAKNNFFCGARQIYAYERKIWNQKKCQKIE
jgi:hypothetical protein